MADYLHISSRQYKAIEKGEQLLTLQQAGELGKLFAINGGYFYRAALQLELLHTRQEIITMQREKIRELQQQVRLLRNINTK